MSNDCFNCCPRVESVILKWRKIAESKVREQPSYQVNWSGLTCEITMDP